MPIISMADQYSHKELKSFKNKIMDLRRTTSIRFFNCQVALKSIVKENQSLINITNSLLRSDKSGNCPPFAIMNPQLNNSQDIKDLGRAKIGQGFISSLSSDFDFSRLF